ncbi:MAG: transketolase [Bacteroidales bacterium]|nr:transketolase [Bacteroidales bacterium]MDD3010073.1 transketolase [Bacteroidales bacterium]MDD3961560.1 transketolase [Bacteroidales bacterium]HPE86067.1 transketolase [Bacteroidales bacterium]
MGNEVEAYGFSIKKAVLLQQNFFEMNGIQLQEMAMQVRRDIVRMVHSSKSGHPGGSLGSADILVALYFAIMNHGDGHFSMEGNGEDMFFLSNGHICPAWYSVLARSGYFPVEELNTLRKLGSRLQGHPTTQEGLPGVRVASGSLGQGISVAIGAALAKKMDNDPHIVYCLTGDGELQEGQIWEAATFAPAKKVDNLIVITDYNRKQIEGPLEQVMDLKDLSDKWRAFGWEVLEMQGNNMDEVIRVLQQAKALSGKGKPVYILAKTEMGFGVDFMMGTHKWHGIAPDDHQLQLALSQLPVTSLSDY